MKDRLAGYPLDRLPDVEAAQAWAKKERERTAEDTGRRNLPTVEKRRHALKIHQQAPPRRLDTCAST